jgi:acetolactate synthase-1/3 small subunit
MSSDINHHILSVLVQNRPGVLARVAGLFARRGYNIYSFKLIDVVKISELDPRRSVERELLLVTVRAQPEERHQVVELVDIFEAKIVAVGSDALTISLEGHPDKLDDFEELLGEYTIVELQRTGRIALPKLDRGARLRAVNPPDNTTRKGKVG